MATSPRTNESGDAVKGIVVIGADGEVHVIADDGSLVPVRLIADEEGLVRVERA